MKLIEAKAAKEFANTFLGDPVLKMAVNAVLNNAPGFELVCCKDCKYLGITGGEYWCDRTLDSFPTDEDNFCAYGKGNE